MRKQSLLCMVLGLFSLCECRVINDELQFRGNYLQFKKLQFIINGDDAEDQSKDSLPPEVEERIHSLIQNQTFLKQESSQCKKLAAKVSLKKGADLKSRKRRQILEAIIPVLPTVLGFLGNLFGLGGNDQPQAVANPYAEQTYLLQQEQFKLEALTFCRDTCAQQWSQWTGCTKQCGSGFQTRSRQLVSSQTCAEKFSDFGVNFTCEMFHHSEETRVCNEGCENGAEPNEIGCSCAPGWGGTCCNIKLYCPFPGVPAGGETTLTTSPIPVGGIALFSCDAGFALNGARHAACQEDQRWSIDVPTCDRVVCTLPVLNEHLRALNLKDTYDFGESVHFGCEAGYVLEGPEHQTCQDSSIGQGRWSHYTPHCTARECPAPTQSDIPHGIIQGSDYTYTQSISFSCHDGYELLGFETLTCTRRGRWSGFYPLCEEISCTPPFPPTNGNIRMYGEDTVEFTCQEGYQLADSNQRIATCGNDGQWSLPTPECTAIECDVRVNGNSIVDIENGNANGGIYRYPHTVQFSCYPGHILQGVDEIVCQENAQWSGEPPTCRPCPLNTYMLDGSIGGVCTACPENSHTSTVGSTNRQQCLCDDGYSGPIGGPCAAVTCPLPNVPINGIRATCSSNVGGNCTFSCNTGYIPSSGALILQCLSNGEWSNLPVTCEACREDSFNPDDERNVCLPCGPHMSTQGRTGQTQTGCVCDSGWGGPPGGPCTDINECEVLAGSPLACEDACRNTVGSFHCECTVPGYEIDPVDGKSCLGVEVCRVLTEEDAPLNGALPCIEISRYNSWHCSPRCNAGFDFADDVTNSYESCGPHTGFIWTFERNFIESGLSPAGPGINNCIPEYFPGLQLHADIYYLAAACEDLTEEQQNTVKEQFIQVLLDNGVCTDSDMSCSIQNVQIICGRREKRDADGNVWLSLDFSFDVASLNVSETMSTGDCDTQICPFLGISSRICQRYCQTAMEQYVKALIMNAENTLNNISLTDIDRVRFELQNQVFRPETIQIHQNQDEMLCPRPGQAFVNQTRFKKSYCLSCKAGTFLRDAYTCEPCPPGTHQLLQEQSSCLPCPLGSYSEERWSYCLSCADGWFGTNCAHRCSCVNGDCDKETGECHCNLGWEGRRCTEDVDRCENVECPVGTTCRDAPAPLDGFRCV